MAKHSLCSFEEREFEPVECGELARGGRGVHSFGDHTEARNDASRVSS